MPSTIDSRLVSRARIYRSANTAESINDAELSELIDVQLNHLALSLRVARSDIIFTSAISSITLSIVGAPRIVIHDHIQKTKHAIDDVGDDDLTTEFHKIIISTCPIIDKYISNDDLKSRAYTSDIGENLHEAIDMFLSLNRSADDILSSDVGGDYLHPEVRHFLEFINNNNLPLAEEIQSRQWIGAMPSETSKDDRAHAVDNTVSYYFSNASSLERTKCVGLIISAPIIIINFFHILF